MQAWSDCGCVTHSGATGQCSCGARCLKRCCTCLTHARRRPARCCSSAYARIWLRTRRCSSACRRISYSRQAAPFLLAWCAYLTPDVMASNHLYTAIVVHANTWHVWRAGMSVGTGGAGVEFAASSHLGEMECTETLPWEHERRNWRKWGRCASACKCRRLAFNEVPHFRTSLSQTPHA